MSVDHESLTSALTAWGFDVSAQQLAQFIQLGELLASWNQRMNLVAPSTVPMLTQRHLLDSIVIATAWPHTRAPRSVADVGSGGGFPGLPLAILWPETRVVLIESIAKKTRFLHHVKQELGLTHVQIYAERVEVLGHAAERERSELVTARAVAQLAVLAEYCLPLCAVHGVWLAPKGPDIDDELAAAQQSITTLGGVVDATYDVEVPGEPVRSLVAVRKVRPTPRQYPRAVGIPAKTPL